MTVITFNVNDADIPRIVQAYEIGYGVKQLEESDIDFIKRHMIAHVDRFVQDAIATKARRDALADHIAIDIT